MFLFQSQLLPVTHLVGALLNSPVSISISVVTCYLPCWSSPKFSCFYFSLSCYLLLTLLEHSKILLFLFQSQLLPVTYLVGTLLNSPITISISVVTCYSPCWSTPKFSCFYFSHIFFLLLTLLEHS